jgi:hypothetical protein
VKKNDHLFFKCIVAKNIWQFISDHFSTPLGNDYLSVARFWIANKTHAALNSVCAATLWCIWKFASDLADDSAFNKNEGSCSRTS